MSTDAINTIVVRTEPEAAAILRTPTRNLARWRSEGNGPKFLKIGRRVAYRDRDLDAWLDRQTRTSTAQRAR
ncbi:MAG: helix-turn-helix domain-containing protein [Acidobacteriota bacterium]|nr:helix-turn-helix domain-containing protein [Acidobacteriota bacterium]